MKCMIEILNAIEFEVAFDFIEIYKEIAEVKMLVCVDFDCFFVVVVCNDGEYSVQLPHDSIILLGWF